MEAIKEPKPQSILIHVKRPSPKVETQEGLQLNTHHTNV